MRGAALTPMPIDPRFAPESSVCGFTRAIEIVAFPAVQMLDLSGPMQVFTSANDMLIKEGRPPGYAVRVVARQDQPIKASSGLGISTEALPALDTPIDTMLIAGGPGVDEAAADPVLVDWVRARRQSARRVASVCTGAFLLAASGALDGRRATTHWSFSAELARRFPHVQVDPDPIFVRDGPVWTSAGVTAGIDLALALLEQDLGRELSLAVARYLVVFLRRPGGQAQFSTALSLQMADTRFAPLHTWIEEHLGEDLSLEALAEQAAMSPRSFSRHYRDATGITPARAVERLRVEEARRLLSDSTLSIKRIAQRCGFGSEETLRRSFLRLLTTTPQDYRARFG